MAKRFSIQKAKEQANLNEKYSENEDHVYVNPESESEFDKKGERDPPNSLYADRTRARLSAACRGRIWMSKNGETVCSSCPRNEPS